MAIWAQVWFTKKEAQHWIWTCSTSSNEDSSSGNKKSCFGNSPPSKFESSSSETSSTYGFWRLLYYFYQFSSNTYCRLFLTSDLICSQFVRFFKIFWKYKKVMWLPNLCRSGRGLGMWPDMGRKFISTQFYYKHFGFINNNYKSLPSSHFFMTR